MSYADRHYIIVNAHLFFDKTVKGCFREQDVSMKPLWVMNSTNIAYCVIV